ncbi:MAG: HEAT repeat domain-containing protein [Planctomycetes bacterium]|nr:HEAT repeat domain-containing protein [Planctomycetota bacterium]
MKRPAARDVPPARRATPRIPRRSAPLRSILRVSAFALWSAIAASSLAAAVSEQAPSESGSSAGGLRQRLLSLSSAQVSDIWDEIQVLRRELAGDEAGLKALKEIAGSLSSLPERSRLAAATLLLHLLPGQEKVALASARVALRGIVFSGGSTDLRVAAVEVLAQRGKPEDVYLVVQALFQRLDEKDPDLRIACYTALWTVDNTADIQPLRQMLRDEREPFRVRASAALALARTGRFDEDVLSILRELRSESGARGAESRLLLELHDRYRASRRDPDLVDRIRELEGEKRRLEERLERAAAAGEAPDAIVSLVELLRARFVDPGRVEWSELYTEAFRAVVARLDYHAELLTGAEIEVRRLQSRGQYLGLGARLTKPGSDSPLVVVQPYYRGPANNPGIPYEDRLLSRDRIVEIDGFRTQELSLQDVRHIWARKSAGDPIRLKVRRGSEERELEFQYGEIEVPVLYRKLFPGKLGYLKLQRFGPTAADELIEGFRSLEEEAEGLVGLLLDLRENGGGILNQALRIVDLFVGSEETRPIVTEAGAQEGRPSSEHLPGPSLVIFCPVVILIDGATASAAEVVAGSLQRYGRARVVGERSYGKGVSQEWIDLPPRASELMGSEALILLPTRYLLLWPQSRFHTLRDPAGRPLPGKERGIEPDVVVQQVMDLLPAWKIKEIQTVQTSPQLDAYLREHGDRLLAAFGPSAGRISRDAASYPRFDELYETLTEALKIRLERGEVLLALRQALLRHIEDLRGEPAFDPREDRQLRTALFELMREAELDPRENPAYIPLLELEEEESGS